MPDRSLDRAWIDGLARRQHGAFHRRQAVRIGFTRSMVRRRENARRWARLAGSDVFALPSHPGSWLRQCMAATLSVPASAASGGSAAALLEFPGWPRARIEIVTRDGAVTRSPFATVHRSSTVGRFTVVDGIRVVSAADCLVQLSARLDADALGSLVDNVARTRRRVLPELCDRYVAVAHSRLPGIGALREALEQRGPGYVPPASELDRHLRLVLVAAGPPSVDSKRRRHGSSEVAAGSTPWCPSGTSSSKVTAATGTPASPTSSTTAGGTPPRWRTGTRPFA